MMQEVSENFEVSLMNVMKQVNLLQELLFKMLKRFSEQDINFTFNLVFVVFLVFVCSSQWDHTIINMNWTYQFQNVTSSPQYSTFLEHIIPRFLTFLQDGEVQFLQEKPTQVCKKKLHSFLLVFFYFTTNNHQHLSLVQQLRKLVLEIIHRIPTNEHLRPHTKNILSVMFRFLEVWLLYYTTWLLMYVLRMFTS